MTSLRYCQLGRQFAAGLAPGWP